VKLWRWLLLLLLLLLLVARGWKGVGGQVGLFIDITSDRLINSHVRKTMCICNHIELHALPEIFRNIFQNSGNKITK
jgi:hypothetical protein